MDQLANSPSFRSLALTFLLTLLANAAGADLCHFEQITDTTYPTHFAQGPSSDGSGRHVSWEGNSDPIGLNPGHTFEVFLFDAATGVIRQLTTNSALGGNPTSIAAACRSSS